jgi:hypothetical protein
MGRLMKRAIRTSSTVAERRRQRRRSLMVEGEVQYGGCREAVTVFDISESGALLHGSLAVALGTDLSLFIPSERLTLNGCVVAARNGLIHLHLEQEIPPQQVDAMAAKYFSRVIERARDEHRAMLEWTRRLDAGKAGDHPAADSSLFARWYDAVSDRVLEDLPAFRALEPLLARLHAAVQEIAETRRAGRDVKALVAELEAEGLAFLAGLDALARGGNAASRAA